MSCPWKDRRRRLVRIAFGIVLVATGIRAWLGPVEWAPVAQAQIPNAGDQRMKQLREAELTNQLLSEILETLRTQTLKVELSEADKKKAGGARPGSDRDDRDR